MFLIRTSWMCKFKFKFYPKNCGNASMETEVADVTASSVTIHSKSLSHWLHFGFRGQNLGSWSLKTRTWACKAVLVKFRYKNLIHYTTTADSKDSMLSLYGTFACFSRFSFLTQSWLPAVRVSQKMRFLQCVYLKSSSRASNFMVLAVRLLQGCRVAGLPGCRVAGLPGCRGAGMLGCPQCWCWNFISITARHRI